MKKVYTTCASLLLLIGTAQAVPSVSLLSTAAKAEWLALPFGQDINERALQLTCYFTDMLHLTQKQAAEVRRLTYQQLQEFTPATEQESATSPAPVTQRVQQYEAAMARILTPDQYSAFRLLEERPVVAQLLGSSLR